MKLLPSIASANPLTLESVLEQLQPWPYLHIDVEDGNFVPNITFGMKTVRAICKKASHQKIQVHLMVTNPMQYLEELASCGVNSVVAQIEALDYPMLFLNRCKALGMKAGFAFNMKTSIKDAEMFLDIADELLFMTAEPDNRGEGLFQPALNRVLTVASQCRAGLEVYADGALTTEALEQLHRAGVAGAVLGRLVFQTEDPLATLINEEKMLGNTSLPNKEVV